MSALADHLVDCAELGLDPEAELERLTAAQGPLYIETSRAPVKTPRQLADNKPGMNGALSSEGAAASSPGFSFSLRSQEVAL